MDPFEPLFVFAADTHLSLKIWEDRPNITGDSYYAFEQIVDYCLTSDLPLVLGGDFFDKRRPDPQSVSFMSRMMSALQNAGVPVRFIQGQHELDREAPWQGVHPWPVWLHDRSDRFGAHIYGIDWQPREKLAEALAQVPAQTEILVAHQVWGDFMGEICSPEGTFSQVPYAQMLLTGDFHQTKIVTATNANGRPMTVVSPGATHARTITDPLQYHFVVIGRSANGELQARTCTLRGRPRANARLLSQVDLDSFCEAGDTRWLALGKSDLPEAVRKPLLRLEYLNLPDAYKRIKAALGDSVHLFPVPIATAQDTVVDYEATPMVFAGLAGAVERLAPTPEIRSGALRLLASPDPASELESMQREFFASRSPAEVQNGQ